MTTLPSVTWPSPPSATLAPRRTERMVVPCRASMGFQREYAEPEKLRMRARCAKCKGRQRARQRDRAHDGRARRQVREQRQQQARGVTREADQVRLRVAIVSRVI